MPEAGTRVRPEGVPESWRIRSSNSPGGAKYYDHKGGSTPLPRTAELWLKTPNLSVQLYAAFVGYGTVRDSRKGPLAPLRASDTGDGSRVPA